MVVPMKPRNALRRSAALTALSLFLSLGVAAPALAAKETSGLKALTELQDVFVELADKVTPSVVNISTGTTTPPKNGERFRQRPESPSSGSGVIIDKNGYIVTNNHVVGDAEEVQVHLLDKRKFTGKVVGRDPDTDLAVVKVESKTPLPTVPLGDSTQVKVGQWVVAVGNPFGLEHTLTVGVVSALKRENVNLSRYEDFIQTDASINPGNSGGPLFNIRGEVIGINTAIINFAQGIGFAIPSKMVQDIYPQLIAKGRVSRGWLGVGIQTVTEELAAQFNLDKEQGVLVNEVFDGEPAQKAGVQAGDIILKIDGTAVDTPTSLAKVVAGLAPGKPAKLTVLRNGETVALSVLLSERKDESEAPQVVPVKTPESMLGLTIEDITQDTADRLKLKDTAGVLVTKVDEDSLAGRGGIKEGDVIKEINRQTIADSTDFRKANEGLKPEDGVLVRIIREQRGLFLVLNDK
ncbi:MAG: Do family serine endopeptidase [Nitrospirota bacterium]